MLSDHVRSLGTPPALTTAVQALYMLGTMSDGGSQSNLELSTGSGPQKIAPEATAGPPGSYLPGAPPDGGKSLDQSDSLNNNSPMERDTNRESPLLSLPQHGSSAQGVVDMELTVIDKNANYGAIKANNNNNNKTTPPAGEPTTSTSSHAEEYSLPTYCNRHEQETEHARHDSKRQSPLEPVERGCESTTAKVRRVSESDCNGESDKHSDSESERTAAEFKCFDCNLIYQRPEWLEGHRSTHGSEQPYKCQVQLSLKSFFTTFWRKLLHEYL